MIIYGRKTVYGASKIRTKHTKTKRRKACKSLKTILLCVTGNPHSVSTLCLEKTSHFVFVDIENDRPKHARSEENVTSVNELVSLLSQEGQKKHFVQHARYPERWV